MCCCSILAVEPELDEGKPSVPGNSSPHRAGPITGALSHRASDGQLAPAGDVCNASACRPKYFLDRMYKAGAKGNFDAFGIHPYYSPQPVDSTSVGDSNTWAATRPSQNERPLVAWHEGSTRWLRLARRVSGRDPDARVNSRLGERPTPV